MEQSIINDIITWDIVNWSKSFSFWEENIDIKNKNFKCLEIGARQGGLSLWLALNGNEVVCSDIGYDKKPIELEKAKKLHEKYNCQDKITYECINALDIPYENEFDIVIMKSTLGGVRQFFMGEPNIEGRAVEQIYKCLKPDGKVLFIENCSATFVHNFARKVKYKFDNDWNYFKLKDIKPLFSNFKRVETKSVGFLGTFGRSEKQRHFLGKIDNVIEKFIPKKNRYIIIGYVEK
jgi:SAM-dependent methyltransferase